MAMLQQPKIRVHRFIWIAVFLAGYIAWSPGYGQEVATSSNTPPEKPSAPEKAESLPQITVTAKVLKQRIDTYISKISGAYVQSHDHPIARWHVPICPLVAGLPRKDGQFVFDRLSDDFESTNIPLGKERCHPNFFIVATMNPEATLKAWWHRNYNLNGDQTGFSDFIGTPRPVRIWYNAKLISGDGTPTNRFGIPTVGMGGGGGNAFQGIESFQISTIPHVEFSAVPDLQFVIAVIDLTSVSGMDWRQVTDYIAMAGSTQVDLDAHVDAAPTIMSLFSTSGNARPQALSEWDRSYIKELYLTDPVLRRQRVLIAKAMFKDVAADDGKLK
jgi:hypothetical protein